jgi:hypothetical protein
LEKAQQLRHQRSETFDGPSAFSVAQSVAWTPPASNYGHIEWPLSAPHISSEMTRGKRI